MSGTSRPLRLPVTERGRRLLRHCVRLAGGWLFPDGNSAADYDWDEAADRAERDNADYERWLAEREGARGADSDD